ncbi:unnamed protein product, partial [Allacma fusca]
MEIDTIQNDSQDLPQAELEELFNAIVPIDQYGHNINDKVAQTFENVIKKDYSKTEVETFRDELKAPENAKLLGVPKVRQELWTSLSTKAKTSDARLQLIQQAISRGLVAISHLTDTLFSSADQVPKEIRVDITKKSLAAAKNLSIALNEMSNQRRQSLKPFLRKEVQNVVSSVKSTTFLFGDDLDAAIKLNKVATKFVRPEYNRFQPYSINRGRGNVSLNSRGHVRSRGG